MTQAVKTEVVGQERLAHTLKAAGDELAHMDAATTDAARAIQTRARPHVPVVSGRLAGSLVAEGTGTEAVVSSGVEYAGVIHYGWAARNIRANPFLLSAAEESSTWESFYVRDVEQILGRVKGM